MQFPTAVGHRTSRLLAALQTRLAIDPRALAAFRIALGLLLLADLARRSRNLTAFYTDFGVFPRAAFVSDAHPLHLSLHSLSGETWVLAALFFLAAGFAVALLVGYRTSIATVGSWLLLVSLHNRLGGVLNGGDFLLRMLLFWAIFLPLGARWAVDSAHGERARARVLSVAGVGLLVQVVLVYLVNAAYKFSGRAWLEGDALEYVFSLGQFTILLGDVIGSYPAVLTVLDYLWLAMVTTSFLLVLLTGRSRTAFVGLFVAMHLGMLFTMRLDLFPLISIASLLPILPAWFWNRVEGLVAPTGIGEGLGRLRTRLAGWLPVVTVTGGAPVLVRGKRALTTLVPFVFLVIIVLWNVQYGWSAAYGETDLLPEEAEVAMDLTRTDQYWNMFAPDPLSTDGWLVAPGLLENGSRIDAFHGGAVVWDRPPDISATYPTPRWRKYIVGLWRGDTADRGYFAEYLCRRWNRHNPGDLQNVSVFFMAQQTRIDGSPEPVERVELATEYC